jgi:hypothetical protein
METMLADDPLDVAIVRSCAEADLQPGRLASIGRERSVRADDREVEPSPVGVVVADLHPTESIRPPP